MVTSRDIARIVGVSQSTVSRALRNDPRVAEATRRRVIEAAERLEYAPNVAARSLVTRRTRTIGVVVADITNPFYPQLVNSLHSEFSLAGYRIVLFNERTDAGVGEELLAQLVGSAVDGALFTSATLGSSLPDLVAARNVPVVLLNRYVDSVGVDWVVADNVRGGELAGRYLYECGHRRIGFIAGPANTSTSRDRQVGFCRALERLGVPLPPEYSRAGAFSHQSGHQWCLEMLSLEPPPTAIFCANDVIAFGALDAARRAGARVPEDLSILGFDDIEAAAWEVFSLTTVRQPIAQMATLAAQMLVERIEGGFEGPARAIAFPTSLVKRATVSSPPGTRAAGAAVTAALPT